METIYLALRVLLSLAVVLAAIWYAHRRLTKGGRLMPRAAKAVTVVTKQSIGAKASVVVMDVDGQRFLLGVTEHSVTVLNTSETPSTEPAQELAAAPAPSVPSLPTPIAGVSTTRPNGGAAFARVLSELQAEPADHTSPAPVAYLPEQRTGALDGSILSPATWKRTAAALRRTP
ncbi:MAG TPA: flagellar biosynthetic protein FliO [Homoserinimonas sp.]|nr:flagellar biosynthetic protein FliO [Homoserinimonas sp.]